MLDLCNQSSFALTHAHTRINFALGKGTRTLEGSNCEDIFQEEWLFLFYKKLHSISITGQDIKRWSIVFCPFHIRIFLYSPHHIIIIRDWRRVSSLPGCVALLRRVRRRCASSGKSVYLLRWWWIMWLYCVNVCLVPLPCWCPTRIVGLLLFLWSIFISFLSSFVSVSRRVP